MSGFAMHSQKAWEEKAGDPQLPGWFRVGAAAFAMHRKNGHATFQPGDLKLLTATVNPETGELVPNANISRDIRTAVRHGLIDKASKTTCLVVPAREVWGGSYGAAHAPCPVHS